MGDKALVGFFEDYVHKESIFSDRSMLQSNFMPEQVLHREAELKQIANILAPALRQERPSNLFVYGKTGTGKTLATKHIIKQLTRVSRGKNIPLIALYLNCKLKRVADTEYRLIAQLIRELGGEIASTGLPTEEVYKAFFDLIDKEKGVYVIVLDEIDQLVSRAGDEILYNLVRFNEELQKSKVALVGISNDLVFIDTIDPRARSSLSEEEIIFAPYNAFQLQDLLRERSAKAFRKGCLQPGVLEKCAAYAAREHGDARRALDLLRVSAELAERNNEGAINISHIDLAEEKIERDRVLDIVRVQPKQSQATLYALLSLHEGKAESVSTGEIYGAYKSVAAKAGLRPLTQRRVSDILAELDMLGIITTSVISKGRYGRTREITSLVPSVIFSTTKQHLEDGLDLS
ncbi:cell division control protein Cdc6 [Candidatus Woesearchaeota archaeon]|nr:cell division control protein Cdc6 [Candidatus Woesearchaeota archaeon]